MSIRGFKFSKYLSKIPGLDVKWIFPIKIRCGLHEIKLMRPSNQLHNPQTQHNAPK